MAFSLPKQSFLVVNLRLTAVVAAAGASLTALPCAEAQSGQEDGIVRTQNAGVSVGGENAGSEKGKKKENLPQSGILSESANLGYQSKNFGMAWGTKSGQETAPLSGSVSRKGANEWEAKLFNNSEDTYSASARVVQLDERGTRLKGDSFSVRLKGGESYSRTFAGTGRTANAQLILESWKNLTPKKEEAEAAGASTTAGGAGARAPNAP